MKNFKHCVSYEPMLAVKRAGKSKEQAEELRKEFNKTYAFSERFGHDTREDAERFADAADDRFFWWPFYR